MVDIFISAYTIFYWLANYCKNNPRSSFDTAVGRLMTELAPQRIKDQPKN